MSTPKNIDQTTEQATPLQEGTSNSGLTRRKFLGLAAAALAMPVLASCSTTSSPTETSATATPVPPTATAIPPTATAVPPTAAAAEAVPVAAETAVNGFDIGIRQPRIIDVSQGLIEMTVEMKSDPNDPNEPKKMLRTITVVDPEEPEEPEYLYPAPTLRMKHRDTVKIRLSNFLPSTYEGENKGECNTYVGDDGNYGASFAKKIKPDVFPNCFHGDNTINLHYHGSHVKPGEGGDDVFVKIKPKQEGEDPDSYTYTYDFEIPDTQAPGTHWYHPHKHGATALHVFNGMAGAFIVDGDFKFVDTETETEALDVLLVFQQIQAALVVHEGAKAKWYVNGELASPPTAPPTPQPGGTRAITIKMRPNEVQRWRLVGATVQASAAIRLEFGQEAGFQWAQIAQDGLQYSWEQFENQSGRLSLNPGNRIDCLVQAPSAPGTYSLVASKTLWHGENKAVLTEDPRGNVSFILNVEVGPPDPSPYYKKWPTMSDWPNVPSFLSKIKNSELFDDQQRRRQRCLVYSMDKKAGEPAPNFYIDGKQYGPERLDHCMVLNTAEEWTIYNTSTVPHPFHIHINPFYVTDVYDPNAEGEKLTHPNRWQDTILLPAAKYEDGHEGEMDYFKEPGFVIIRHRFKDFAGTFVNHCHMLGHEDRGMMQKVEVIDLGTNRDLAMPKECFDATWDKKTCIKQDDEVGIPINLKALSGPLSEIPNFNSFHCTQAAK